MNPTDEFLDAAARLDEPSAPAEPPPETDAAEGGSRSGPPSAARRTGIAPGIRPGTLPLGLVYDVEPIENLVRVTYSLTTPGCPMEEIITGGIVNAVAAVPGVDSVLPNLVWEPRWHPGMIAEGAW